MPPKRFECQDCGTRFADESELVWPISDLEERVLPGEIMPYGECPECGAVVHLMKGKRDDFDDA